MGYYKLSKKYNLTSRNKKKNRTKNGGMLRNAAGKFAMSVGKGIPNVVSEIGKSEIQKSADPNQTSNIQRLEQQRRRTKEARLQVAPKLADKPKSPKRNINVRMKPYQLNKFRKIPTQPSFVADPATAATVNKKGGKRKTKKKNGGALRTAAGKVAGAAARNAPEVVRVVAEGAEELAKDEAQAIVNPNKTSKTQQYVEHRRRQRQAQPREAVTANTPKSPQKKQNVRYDPIYAPLRPLRSQRLHQPSPLAAAAAAPSPPASPTLAPTTFTVKRTGGKRKTKKRKSKRKQKTRRYKKLKRKTKRRKHT